MSKTHHKRKADDEDDVAAEAQQRAQTATAHAPSHVLVQSTLAAAAAAHPSVPNLTAALTQSNAEYLVGSMHPSSSPSTTSSSAAAADGPIQPAASAAVAASADSTATAADGQMPPMAAASFNRLADVEVQLVMQHLECRDLLHLARCNRALFRCASHSLAWQRLSFPVNVRGSEVIEDPRRTRSLLRFALSSANIQEHASDPSSLVSCATLLRVHQLGSLEFAPSPQPIMQLDEWHAFLQHPNAQRLVDLNLWLQPALCDAVSVSLLSQLPLLRFLRMSVHAEPSPSYLEPLTNAPSFTHFFLSEPLMSFSQLPAPLEPLARCTRLHTLSLDNLLLPFGRLSELLMHLTRAGIQLRLLSLSNLRLLETEDASSFVVPDASDALDFELVFAAPSLSHLHELALFGHASGLEFVSCIPSLRKLLLSLSPLPSASKLALLLHRLPHLRITIQPPTAGYPDWQENNEAMLPQLVQLAQQHPRLSIIKDL